MRAGRITAAIRAGAVASAVVALAALARGEDRDAGEGLREADRELLIWFEGLGFPMPEGGAFGEVVLVRDAADEDDETGEPKRSTLAWGFLVGEDERELRLRTVALEEDRIPRGRSGWGGKATASFEPRDLLAALRSAADVTAEGRHRPPFSLGWFGGPDDLDECSEWVVASWIAARRDEPALARRLLGRAEAEAARRDAERGREGDVARGLRGWLSEELSEIAIWRMKLDLDRPDSRREDVLADCRRIMRVFPGTKHAEEAARHAAVLERMVAEDAEHARTAKSWDAMSPEERVAELIFQLRDQDGAQWMQPGGPTIFTDPREKESPAERLVAMGAQAVPLLIEHLDDPRYTRTVGFWRDFTYSHYVVTVGEACADVLSRISGRGFGTLWNERWSPERAKETRQAAEEWWATFREGGERAAVVAALREGGKDARMALRRLVELDRALAVEEGLAAIERAPDDLRYGLQQEIGAVAEDPRVEAFLLRAATEGPTRQVRVHAACVLLRRGIPGALQPALDAWRGTSPGSGPWDDEHLMRTLLEFGGAEGGDAVLATLTASGPRGRMAILRSATSWRAVVPGDAGVRDRLADHLAPLLDDRTDTGARWSTEDRTGGERVADLAADWLAPLLDDGARFVRMRAETERDADIARLRERWRSARGLPPMPPAPDRFPAVEPLSAERAGPLVARVVSGDAEAVREIESLGLAALPAVRERAETLQEGHPDGDRLRALASRLARTVRAVDLVGTDDAPAALAEAAKSLRGRPFDADALLAVVREAAAAVAGKPVVAEVRVERPRDADGVVVRVAWRRGDPPGDGLTIEWTASADGRRHPGGSYGVSGATRLDERQAEALREAWTPCESARRDRELECVVRVVP